MPIKILSVDTFAATGAPVDDIQLSPIAFLPPGTDADGGRMVAGNSGDGPTLSYIAADGTETEVLAGLPDGVAFSQGTGVPIAGGPDFLMATVMEDPESPFTMAGLAIASLDGAGQPTLSPVDGLLDMVPESVIVEEIELFSLENGQTIAVVNTFNEETGEMATITGLVGQDGPDFNFSVVSNVGDNATTSPSETLVAQTPAGETVVVTGYMSTEDGALSFEVSQIDSTGNLIATQTLSEAQVSGLDAVGQGFVSFSASITEDGELKLSIVDEGLDNIDTAQTTAIVFDLLPEQSDAPGIVLAEEPDGKDIYRTDGDNVLRGGQFEDYIDAGNGDDLVYGKGDNDYLVGGTGWDTVYGGSGSDYIDGDAGFDSLYGGDGNDFMYGGMGKDFLAGGAGNDFMSGGAWNDVMRGGSGQDEMYGGGGKDDLNGGRDDDYVDGGAGDDKVSGYDGDDSLFGGDGADSMHGGFGDDILFGGAGDDIMRGSWGNDTLYGDEGDDTLFGGFGEDVFAYELYGPQAVDVIDLDDEGPGGEELLLEDPELKDNGSDLIAGFEVGTDKILIDGSFLVADPDDPLATQTTSELTFDDIFLSQEDSVAVIQAGDMEIRLKSVKIDELSEDDFILI